MAKKRQRPLAAVQKKKEAAPNRFELLSKKSKFEVLGKKVKGDTRNVLRLRSAAAEKRKSTLLVEYKQLRKSNAFIDRRFGEDDESLTADEKAILRFQKQRLKELAGGKFSLPDEGEEEGGEQLTHLGRSLAELNDVGPGWGSEEDDDGGLGEELTRDMHFGGGLFERKERQEGAGGKEEEEEGEGQPAKKSKKEVMEEIIAKSKAAKAQKTQQREEDVLETERLDSAFRSLLGDPALLALMRKKGQKMPTKGDTLDDQRFDVMTKELVFEAKAQPGDRTLSAEEAAEAERARLERLEAQRLKRMQGEGAEDEDEFEDEDGEAYVALDGSAPAGGYAARRARQAERAAKRAKRAAESGDGLGEDDEFESGSEESGSEGDDDEESEEDEEGLTNLDRRRRQRAAGDHPLQGAFREASAALLAKYGIQPAEEGGSESEEEGGSGSEGEELEGGSDEEELASGSESEEEMEEEEEEEEEEEQPQKQRQQPGGPAAAAAAAAAGPGVAQRQQAEQQEGVGLAAELPFTPPLPKTYEEFAGMAQGLSATDLGELVRRIRAYNAPKLTTEHRKGLQLLYGVLVQHFATLAGGGQAQQAQQGQQGGISMAHLDALVPHLIDMTPQVPYYAATLARARLQRTQQRLASGLKSADPAQRAAAWPAPRALLLLQLWASVFPTTDKRHPVLTPAGLLACGCLALCPLARPHQVALGLFLASLAMHLHSQARRFVPEPLNFAVGLLESVLPQQPQQQGGAAAAAGQVGAEEPRWLCIPLPEGGSGTAAPTLPATAEAVQPLNLQEVLSRAAACAAAASSGAAGPAEGEGYFSSPEFKTAAAAAAARLVGRCAEVFADVAALPEVLVPAQRALRRILAAGDAQQAQQQPAAARSSKSKKRKAAAAAQQQQQEQATAPACLLAPGLLAVCREVLASVDAAAEAVRGRRRPLVSAALSKVAEVKQFNPRYEENYATGKDYDPDRERAERRRLQRQLRKEERGAMRELRKDAGFMAVVRDKEKAAKQEELDRSAKKAINFLQQQESDFKSGGQGGMWKKGKKGKK